MSRSVTATRSSRTAALTVSVLLAAAITSCSSSGSGSAASTGSSPKSGGSTAAVTPSSSPATSAAAGGGGVAAGGSFCTKAAAAQAQQEQQASALTTGSPAALQKLEQKALAELQGFATTAPAAIKSDVQVVVAVDQKFFAALSAAHFDVHKLDPTTFKTLDTPAFTTATTHIASYLSKECGIKTGG